MNKKLSTTYLVVIIALFFFGCRGPVREGHNSNTPAGSLSLHDGDEKYLVIDKNESAVTWRGSNSFGSHAGYVSVSKGELMIEDGQLAGGIVEIDMSTIEDEGHKSNNNLIKHLKDPDFFDVEKFPFSTIKITGVESITAGINKITGNLTIKGITHEVTFPANIELKSGMVNANARLVIDRTDWGVRYKSGKFFHLLADKTISDSIEFQIKIVGKK